MKKIVVASDSFKGSVSSSEVADCVAQAIHAKHPDWQVVKVPIADGGEGTTDAFLTNEGGECINNPTYDPLMRPITAEYAILPDHTAIIEVAAASGLTLLTPEERNPLTTTSYGTGILIKDAIRRGCTRLLLGAGGSATNDGGTGILQALGYTFRDNQGNLLDKGGAILNRIHTFDQPDLKHPEITILTDVTNPFHGKQGAAHTFARQKGANEAEIQFLDEGLRNFAQVIQQTTGKDINRLPGSGAAGGIAGGLAAFLDAEIHPGIQYLLDHIRFADLIRGADLIITGEGKLDRQTLLGKAPFGILTIAKKENIPVVAIAGIVEDKGLLLQAGFREVHALKEETVPLEQAMTKEYTKQALTRWILNAGLIYRE